jgi:hypothetical protein
MFEDITKTMGCRVMSFIYNNIVKMSCRNLIIMAMQIGCCLYQKISCVIL